MSEEAKIGFNDGYRQGVTDGRNRLSMDNSRGLNHNRGTRYASGYVRGYEKGYAVGQQMGYSSVGYNRYNSGYSNGYQNGYNRIYNNSNLSHKEIKRRKKQQNLYYGKQRKTSFFTKAKKFIANTSKVSSSVVKGASKAGSAVVKGTSRMLTIPAKTRRVACEEKLSYGATPVLDKRNFICIYNDQI